MVDPTLCFNFMVVDLLQNVCRRQSARTRWSQASVFLKRGELFGKGYWGLVSLDGHYAAKVKVVETKRTTGLMDCQSQNMLSVTDKRNWARGQDWSNGPVTDQRN